MAQQFPMPPNREELWSEITKLQNNIFDKYTIPSKYSRVENGEVRYLRFPLPDDLFWSETENRVESFNQSASLLDTSEADRDIVISLRMLGYFVSLNKIRSTFAEYMERAQEKLRQSKKRAAHLIGAIQMLSLDSDNVSSKQKIFIKDTFHQVTKDLFDAAHSLELSRRWSITADIGKDAEHWTDLSPGETPHPFHLNLFPQEKQNISNMVSDLSRSANHCMKDEILEDQAIVDDIDVLKTAIEQDSLEQVSIFDIEDLQKPSFPDSDMQILLVDPYAIVPSQTESISLSEDKEKEKVLEEKEKVLEENLWEYKNYIALLEKREKRTTRK